MRLYPIQLILVVLIIKSGDLFSSRGVGGEQVIVSLWKDGFYVCM